MNNWHPTGVARNFNRIRPEVGDVVAYDRRAWEVRHISDADPTSDEQDRIVAYRPEHRARYRPYRVTLRRTHGAKHERENSAGDIGLRVRAGAYNPLPAYPDGRVPLCSCHGEPWPCREADEQAQAAKELKATEKILNLLPGCCPACEEPVTSRQKSITFGGPNVRNPLAEGPTYHLRLKCWSAAAAYEEAWVNDEPGRKRSLLTLRCEGTVIVHGDGTAECFGAEDSDCPSIYAQHRCYRACYMQTLNDRAKYDVRRFKMDVPAKNLLGIPWRTAFALQDDGWILRNDVIWSKPNAMPESVTDRLSTRHEHLFMCSKSPRYWFDLDPIREPTVTTHAAALSWARDSKEADVPGQSMRQHRTSREHGKASGTNLAPSGKRHTTSDPSGRNPGDVWTVPTQPFAEAHFAVMPQALAERAILAGCKPGGVVLDPFSGSGTTGLAAAKHGRKYVGIDLNADYLGLSLRTRLAQPALDFGEVTA